MPPPNERLRNLGFLMRDVSRLYGRHFERQARELELTLAQCKVLAHLQRNEGISQARLAELTETDPMTLVRTLDRMQQDRWIERQPDPSDRRAHRLYLREEAKPVLARMWKIADQARSDALCVLGEQECEQLLELLGRLHVHLQQLDSRAAEARRPHS
ncbi:MAG TPA: MarR family transcriptional regulator [Steroidobacteraceae bacterium]|nr:MarR family transcriptional regulator [Steroidobacteraceae bacterium]